MNDLTHSEDTDLGRSKGKPKALDQHKPANTPNPLETPNNTV